MLSVIMTPIIIMVMLMADAFVIVRTNLAMSKVIFNCDLKPSQHSILSDRDSNLLFKAAIFSVAVSYWQNGQICLAVEFCQIVWAYCHLHPDNRSSHHRHHGNYSHIAEKNNAFFKKMKRRYYSEAWD